MLSKKLILCIFVVLVAGQWAVSLNAQQPCQPPVLPPSQQPNIFTEAQDSDLGDAEAAQIQRHYKVIDDDALTAHLTEIGNRIVKYLPPTNMRFQFFLVDLPTANAFEISGGRIYISRKLIGFANNEDEIAGVISHENRAYHLASGLDSDDLSF